MNVVRSSRLNGMGMNVVRSRLSGLGYVDPTIDTMYASDVLPDPSGGASGSYDPSAPAVPFGPQPTPETVAINQLVQGGYMTDPNAPAPVATTAPAAPSLTSWLSSLFKPAVSTLTPGLPPGPAPRVNVPLTTSSAGMFLTGSTLFAGIPNIVVIGGGLLALMMLSGGGGKRRR